MPVLFLPFAGCEQPVEPVIHNPEEASKVTPVVWADLSLPPISTFERSCAHCHGRAGELFILPYRHQGDALKQILEEMLVGPAQLSPTTADINAMIIYHEAIADNKPFVIVTNAESFTSGATSTLRGQVSLGATVRIVANDNTLAVVSDSVDWYLEKAPVPPLIVEAESQDGVNRIRLE